MVCRWAGFASPGPLRIGLQTIFAKIEKREFGKLTVGKLIELYELKSPFKALHQIELWAIGAFDWCYYIFLSYKFLCKSRINSLALSAFPEISYFQSSPPKNRNNMGNSCGCEVLSPDIFAHWDFPKFTDQYLLSQVIGTGHFSTVHQATDLTGKPIAVKVIKNPQSKDMQRLYREVQVLSQAKHRAIVGYLGCYQKGKRLYIGMELCAEGSLRERLRQGVLSEEEGRKVAIQLLEALKYLHSLGIIHRDIKAENVLIDDFGNVKLADFGFARDLNCFNMSIVGSPFHLSPELSTGSYDEKSDIWSLGVLLYFALLGEYPFQGKTAAELYYETVHKDITQWGSVSSYGFDFLSLCFTRKSCKRPSASDLLLHPWLCSDTVSTDDSP